MISTCTVDIAERLMFEIDQLFVKRDLRHCILYHGTYAIEILY